VQHAGHRLSGSGRGTRRAAVCRGGKQAAGAERAGLRACVPQQEGEAARRCAVQLAAACSSMVLAKGKGVGVGVRARGKRGRTIPQNRFFLFTHVGA
jgi:hypothetical protein